MKLNEQSEQHPHNDTTGSTTSSPPLILVGDGLLAPPTPAHPTGRVLVVDDDREQIDFLLECLIENGYEVVGKSSVDSALRALEGHEFDVLITDLVMPHRSGLDLLREAHGIDQNLVTIIITNYSSVPSAVELMRAGAFDYVRKPIDPGELIPALNRAVAVGRLKRENSVLRQTVAVSELIRAIAGTLELDEILNALADTALQQCDGDEVAVMLPTLDGSGLRVVVVRGADRERLVGQVVPVERSIAGWVATKLRPLNLQGEVSDRRFASPNPRREVNSVVIPLLAGGRSVGVVTVNSTRRRRAFTVGDLKVMSIIAATAAAAIESAQLYQKYRSVFETSVEGIYQTMPDGRLLIVNRAMARILGYGSPEELVIRINEPGEQIYVDPSRRVELRKQLEPHGLVSEFESEVYRRDGSVICVSENASAVHDRAGNLLYIQGTMLDITDRKRTEEALQEANLRLSKALEELKVSERRLVSDERLRALGQMASGIAHDFNNSLSPVLGFSDLLLAQPSLLEDPAKTRHYVEKINVAARDAANIVTRLRAFYRLRQDNEVFEAVHLNQVVEQAVALAEPRWKGQAQAGGAQIHVQCQLGDLPCVPGQESELRQLLVNLIFNAVDAMPDGGDITVSTRCEPAEPADGNGSAARAVLEVRDTGTGMPEEVRSHCFEPYFSTKGERGTGLGLAMVQGIVSRHAGSIQVDTEPGKGTTFTIRFPTSHEVPPATPLEGRVMQRQLNILVVDDEADLRDTVKALLDADGHRVHVASCGHEGLQMFCAGVYDVVITDRAMDDVSGDQLAILVKDEAPATPVILLTGFGDLMTAANEQPPGVDLVLGKPVSIAHLRNALAKVCN